MQMAWPHADNGSEGQKEQKKNVNAFSIHWYLLCTYIAFLSTEKFQTCKNTFPALVADRQPCAGLVAVFSLSQCWRPSFD